MVLPVDGATTVITSVAVPVEYASGSPLDGGGGDDGRGFGFGACVVWCGECVELCLAGLDEAGVAGLVLVTGGLVGTGDR